MKHRHRAAIVCSLIWFLVCAATIFVAPVAAAPINGLYVFGDSLSDPGNNAIAMGSTASPPECHPAERYHVQRVHPDVSLRHVVPI